MTTLEFLSEAVQLLQKQRDFQDNLLNLCLRIKSAFNLIDDHDPEQEDLIGLFAAVLSKAHEAIADLAVAQDRITFLEAELVMERRKYQELWNMKLSDLRIGELKAFFETMESRDE